MILSCPKQKENHHRAGENSHRGILQDKPPVEIVLYSVVDRSPKNIGGSYGQGDPDLGLAVVVEEPKKEKPKRKKGHKREVVL